MDRRPEQSGSGSDTTPFWERYGLRSERSESEAGCSYTSFINVQCRLQESDKGGRPSRKCERLIRKFRDCGRGKEEIESAVEEIIDHDYKPDSSLEKFLRDATSGQQQLRSAPLDSNVGEALEEFVEYAEKLKRKAVGVAEPKNGLSLDDTYVQKQISEVPLPATYQYEPWYSRLFHRRAQCSPGRQRPWENFKKDFQEV